MPFKQGVCVMFPFSADLPITRYGLENGTAREHCAVLIIGDDSSTAGLMAICCKSCRGPSIKTGRIVICANLRISEIGSVHRKSGPCLALKRALEPAKTKDVPLVAHGLTVLVGSRNLERGEQAAMGDARAR